jgi:hypothetical protein
MPGKTKLESDFEADFMKEVDIRFPGGFWTKGNSAFRQGVPDRFFFWGEHWAALELKRARGSAQQENQDYYIQLLDGMSYAAFVTPENYREVLDEMDSAFGVRR